MSMIKNFIAKLLGFGTPHASANLKIVFYKEANYHGEHGRLVVSHVKHGLVETSVAMAFVGVTTPPVMDLTLMIRIWDEAEKQGFIPHRIMSYGRSSEIIFEAPAADNPTRILQPVSFLKPTNPSVTAEQLLSRASRSDTTAKPKETVAAADYTIQHVAKTKDKVAG